MPKIVRSGIDRQPVREVAAAGSSLPPSVNEASASVAVTNVAANSAVEQGMRRDAAPTRHGRRLDEACRRRGSAQG
jgi:hypothetical protein